MRAWPPLPDPDHFPPPRSQRNGGNGTNPPEPPDEVDKTPREIERVEIEKWIPDLQETRGEFDS